MADGKGTQLNRLLQLLPAIDDGGVASMAAIAGQPASFGGVAPVVAMAG